MEDKINLNFHFNEINKAVISVELPENVLGGSDAMFFTSKIEELLISDTLKYIIINFKNVVLINSSGLGMLVGALTILKRRNIQLFLTNIPTKILNLLKMTHLNEVFGIYGDMESALKMCK